MILRRRLQSPHALAWAVGDVFSEFFKEQYKDIPISEVISDIGDVYLLMDDITKTMTQNRIKEIPIDEALEKHMILFNQGTIFLRKLYANRDELNKK